MKTLKHVCIVVLSLTIFWACEKPGLESEINEDLLGEQNVEAFLKVKKTSNLALLPKVAKKKKLFG